MKSWDLDEVSKEKEEDENPRTSLFKGKIEKDVWQIKIKEHMKERRRTRRE